MSSSRLYLNIAAWRVPYEPVISWPLVSVIKPALNKTFLAHESSRVCARVHQRLSAEAWCHRIGASACLACYSE